MIEKNIQEKIEIHLMNKVFDVQGIEATVIGVMFEQAPLTQLYIKLKTVQCDSPGMGFNYITSLLYKEIMVFTESYFSRRYMMVLEINGKPWSPARFGKDGGYWIGTNRYV